MKHFPMLTADQHQTAWIYAKIKDLIMQIASEASQ